MARSSTTVVKGQKLAFKHGAYSASGRLTQQNRVVEQARERYKQGKLTPLELDAYTTLERTKARLLQVSSWLDSQGGPLTPRGKVRNPANLEERLLKSVHAQTMALWRMLLTNQPAMEDLSVQDAQSYLNDRYAPSSPAAPASVPPDALNLQTGLVPTVPADPGPAGLASALP